MAPTRKRKNPQSKSTPKNPRIRPISIQDPNRDLDPYPSHARPTPDECTLIRDTLLQFHGFPLEFAKYRNQRQGEGDGEEGSVLDGLVSTVLSQNTTDLNSKRAFDSLKNAFPTWEEVLATEAKLIEDAIRCGGLAPTKALCIKNILTSLVERKGELSLEYLRDLPLDEIKAELSSFKGIGPKTVACVLMFHLHKDDFPVDTHIFQIAKTLGWVPAAADTKKTYLHLNRRIPDELKFDLNCLLFTHGKVCSGCAIRKGKQEKKDSSTEPCPLLKYCNGSDWT